MKFNLVKINFSKKVNLISIIFMILSISVLMFIAIMNANFSINEYELFLSKEEELRNFFSETLMITEILILVFIILMVELELLGQSNNFDAFFISRYQKSAFLFYKLLTYFLIISIYIGYVYIGISIVYLIRFNETNQLSFILSDFIETLKYSWFLFLISFLIVTLFRNYFSVFLTFFIFWISKILSKEEVDLTLKYIILRKNSDFFLLKSSLEVPNLYYFTYIFLLFLMLVYLYKDKDLKI